ncbi:MAG: 6-phosphogluconolactonase [Deltaproteobacteria bacterium]
MPDTTVEICANAGFLAERAADLLTDVARKAILQRGRFTLVLAGGSTPKTTYSLLAGPERVPAIDWSKVYFFFGDERFVPPGDPASNYRMVQRVLLSRVAVAASQVFPIPTAEPTPAESAAAYSRELGRFFEQAPDSAPPPRFDLVLLGVGDDGHTASLFQGKPAVDVDDRWVTWSPPGVLPPSVNRVTMTFPLLNAAHNVVFLAAGEKKAHVVKEILDGPTGGDKYPASRIAPAEGELTWLLDEPAAARLTRR